MAAGHWPGAMEPASAVCRVDADGTMTVVTSVADMSGVNSGFAVIAAAAFGLPPDQVRVVTADTASAPVRGRERRIEGHLHRRPGRAARGRGGAREAARRRLAGARDRAGRPRGGRRRRAGGGRARPLDHGARKLASKALRFGGRYEPIEGHGGSAQTSGAPSVAAHLSHVRVDRETGEVTLLRHVIAQDVGRALNPALVEGQMRGGADAGHRLGALRAARPRRGRPPAHRLVPRLRDPRPPSASPRSTRSSWRCLHRTDPSARRASARRPSWARRRRSRTRSRAAAGTRLYELPMTPPRVWQALRS